MPPPVFKKVSDGDVLKNIEAIIGAEKLKELEQKKPSMLKDMVNIAILMSDAEACYDSLAVLNDRLVRKIESEKIVVYKPTEQGLQLARKEGENEAGEVKHYGLLSGFFKVWEGMCGFNAAQTINANAKGVVPTLTQFVPPAQFRSHLLSPGYHWKDPGVGVRHGEFTHRVHWYIVIQEDKSRKFLNNTPLEIFTMFADDLCLGLGENPSKTVWDAVFDKTGVADFRQAESLHGWLKGELQTQDPKVGVLAQLVAGRALKREHDKLKYDPDGVLKTDWYKEKMKQKEQNKTVNVMAKSERDLISWHKPADFHPQKVSWTVDDIKTK